MLYDTVLRHRTESTVRLDISALRKVHSLALAHSPNAWIVGMSCGRWRLPLICTSTFESVALMGVKMLLRG